MEVGSIGRGLSVHLETLLFPLICRSSPRLGFQRFLSLLANHDWTRQPLIVNFSGKLSSESGNCHHCFVFAASFGKWDSKNWHNSIIRAAVKLLLGLPPVLWHYGRARLSIAGEDVADHRMILCGLALCLPQTVVAGSFLHFFQSFKRGFYSWSQELPLQCNEKNEVNQYADKWSKSTR